MDAILFSSVPVEVWPLNPLKGESHQGGRAIRSPELGKIKIVATQIHLKISKDVIFVTHLTVPVLLRCASQVKVHVLTIEKVVGHIKRHGVRIVDVGRAHLE
jgi:hypothetical protein